MSTLKLVLVTAVIFSNALMHFSAKAFAQETATLQQESATLRINFRFEGPKPTLEPIHPPRDTFCSTCEIPNESLLIGKNGGLENIVLIWDEQRNSQHLPRFFEKPKSKQVEFIFERCRLKPHIAIARVGQEVVFRNRDPIGHAPGLMLFNAPGFGGIVNPNNPAPIKLTVSEPTVMPVKCEIHPWERSFIVVKDHPYVGISNAEGAIEIKGLPTGKNWFRIWHESTKQPFAKIDWNGKQTEIQRGRIELDLKAGVNDLGTIALNADQFSLGP